MDNIKSEITILTCHDKGKKRATKEFELLPNGTIKKITFSAGKYFTHEEREVSCLEDLARVLDDLRNEPKKFVIRGKIKEKMTKVVRRKIHGEDAAFESVSRPYLMLDIDKVSFPDHLNPAVKPEAIVGWILSMLPEPFVNVSCYYKFSSSQNVPDNISDLVPKKASLHIWFWLNRTVSEDEWKSYFKESCEIVDCALFSAVQVHYTADPIFKNMANPLPNRSGLYKCKFDIVKVPPIPELEKKPYIFLRPDKEPEVSEEEKVKALELLRPFYQEGSRNDFCGAISGALYRGGWHPENIANFVRELAEMAHDEEAEHRYNNAYRVCDAIENNFKAKGIPSLKEDFQIKELDILLGLLGLGKLDIDNKISKLRNSKDFAEIKHVIEDLIPLSKTEQSFYLDEIKNVTKLSKSTLEGLLREVKEVKFAASKDPADQATEVFLKKEFLGGDHLIRSSDKNYWVYNRKNWQIAPEDYIKSLILPYARDFSQYGSTRRSVALLQKSIMQILEGRTFKEADPLRSLNSDFPPVINCQNGELWFNEKGDFDFKPHRYDNYLKSCLEIDYNPDAHSPQFDQAVLEIFSKSTNPHDMYRHFMEVAGYICQTYRGHAVIILLYGQGSNGKTSLMDIIIRIIGQQAVMSDRIGEIEGNDFKIGALDGKLMIYDDDAEKGIFLPDGFLKKISEKKIMTGQHKHKPTFQFIARAVPVMLSNSYPAIKDLSYGLRRRLMVIPFNRQFDKSEIKPELFETIWEEEASGIFNQIIKGFQRLKLRGGFLEPEDCIEAREEWLKYANVLTYYIEEYCERNVKKREFLKDFYEEFSQFCIDEKVRYNIGRRGVEERLKGLGYRIGEVDGSKVIWGLKIKNYTAFEAHPNLRIDD